MIDSELIFASLKGLGASRPALIRIDDRPHAAWGDHRLDLTAIKLDAPFGDFAAQLARGARADSMPTQQAMLVVSLGVLWHHGLPRPTRLDGELQWPELRAALTPQPRLRNSGWVEEVLAPAPPARVTFDRLETFAIELRSRRSAAGATNPSQPEQIMMAALLRTGLPEPRRDVSVHDASGTLRAKPDYAWPDIMLALELDGWWPHVGRDADSQRRGTWRTGSRTQMAKDAAKRRLMTQLGWTVIITTDDEVNERGGAARVAADAAALHASLTAARR